MKCLRKCEMRNSVHSSSRKHAHGEPGDASCPWGPPSAPSSSYGLIQQGGDVFFLVPVGCAEHHHSILRKRVGRIEGRTVRGSDLEVHENHDRA
jgi:hypothetical protein